MECKQYIKIDQFVIFSTNICISCTGATCLEKRFFIYFVNKFIITYIDISDPDYLFCILLKYVEDVEMKPTI